jgi:hypothetical protein
VVAVQFGLRWRSSQQLSGFTSYFTYCLVWLGIDWFVHSLFWLFWNCAIVLRGGGKAITGTVHQFVAA